MDGHQALSASQIKRFSSAFRKFDTDKDGNINGKDLGKILRYIGHNPTEAEIQVRRCKLRCDDTVCGWEKVGVVHCSQLVSCFQEMIANADKDGTGTLDLIEFLQMMKEKISDQNKEEEIGEAFRVFDIVIGDNLDTRVILSLQDRNGYIDRRELGLMMKFMGEPVTQEEIDVRSSRSYLTN